MLKEGTLLDMASKLGQLLGEKIEARVRASNRPDHQGNETDNKNLVDICKPRLKFSFRLLLPVCMSPRTVCVPLSQTHGIFEHVAIFLSSGKLHVLFAT